MVAEARVQAQQHAAVDHDVAGRATNGRARMLVATRPYGTRPSSSMARASSKDMPPLVRPAAAA